MKKQPIRIAQIIGKWVGGGVEAVVMNYYRHIDKNKIQFDFICDEDSTNIPYDEIEKLGGRVIIVPPYQKVIKYHKELKKVLKEGNYKIVHSHINTLSVFSLYAAKKAGVHVRIAHSHSTTNKKEWKKNIVKQLLRPFVKLFATHYMACTEHAGRWLFGNRTFDKGRVYILNNAIDLNNYKHDKKVRERIRKELKYNNNDIVIGHIGRFVAQKNHDFLIDLFYYTYNQNNNYRLLLIGQGPLQETIKEKVKRLKLDKVVVFLGQKENANEYYSAMDLFLLPSLYEGLGMVAIEAQVAGLPCIVSSEIPKVAKVSNLFSFNDLKFNVKKWFEMVKEFTRKTNILNSNVELYNIFTKSDQLEKKYLKLIKEEKADGKI